MLPNEQIAASRILQHLRAERAYRELERREARQHFAAKVRIIWAERTFLFRISVLGLFLGLAIAFLIPPRYTSTTRLMPPDDRGASTPQAMMSLRGVSRSQVATDMLRLRTTSDLFADILDSRTVQDKIIGQFDLKQVYGTSHMVTTRRVLAGRVDISVDRKSDVITISVTDRDPQRAAAIANAYVEELNRLVIELSTSSARRERTFLETFLVQVKKDLENAEKEFGQFSSKNNTIDLNEQGKALVGAAANVQGQLIVAQSELEALRQLYTDSNARVRMAQARIEELQSQLRKLAGNAQVSAIGPNSQASELYPSIRKLPVLGATFADLYRRVKLQETVYELLTQEYNLAKVQEARDIPTVKVLDVADVPESKSFPPRATMTISSMLLAFIAAIGVVLGWKSWNDKDPQDLGKAVASEIWIDLKEKRFLTPGNNSEGQGVTATNSLPRKSGILSFLGLSNASRHPDGLFSTSERFSKRQASETKLPDTLSS